MSESDSNPIRDAIAEAISGHDTILFMKKGSPDAPACGFSARTVAMLQSLEAPFAAVDILPDPRIRQELSAISNWPTIPQLFHKGELIGGCDIVTEMYESGELSEALGLPDSDAAASEPVAAESQPAGFRPSRTALGEQVAVVSDTTNYLPRDLANREGIHQVSLYVGWHGHPEREIEMESFDPFYERLRTDPDLPTTSQPSIGDFLAVWEPLLDEGKDIVSVQLAGGISGTCESARQAHNLLAERGLGDRVEVIDGETACGGTGLLLLAAAAAARNEADKDAVVTRVREARAALKIWFCVDTLEYLRRGGRVGKAQAWIGGTLKIKPILSLEYEITPVERVRTAKRAFERMVQYAQELHDNGADRWVVQHIQAQEQADRLMDRCREIFGSEPIFTSEVGPVIGTYTGPGLLGVGALPNALVS